MNTLKDSGFLTMDEDHFLHLTDTGLEVAEQIYEKHCFFKDQLIAAGVAPKTAKDDACRIEHVISDESFFRLKEMMRKRKLGAELDHLDVFDGAYEKRYEKVQSELDDCYDKADEIENKILTVTENIKAANKGVRTAENIEKILDNFGELYEKMSCEERRQMYRMFIDRIEVFPEEKPNGRILKSITFRFSVPIEEEGVRSDGAETDIRFTLDCSKTELTAAEAKATYAEIKKKDRLTKYAEFQHMEIVREYCDAGKSGKNISGRPEFSQMLQDVAEDRDGVDYINWM